MTVPSLRELIDEANKTVRKTGWHIWLSDAKRLWATRSNPIAEMGRRGVEARGLWVPCGETITADSLPQMLAKIKRRAAL